jgi:hypothetical protein
MRQPPVTGPGRTRRPSGSPATSYINHRRSGAEQQRQQQTRDAGGHVDRPDHLAGGLTGTTDQRLERDLAVGHVLAEHRPCRPRPPRTRDAHSCPRRSRPRSCLGPSLGTSSCLSAPTPWTTPPAAPQTATNTHRFQSAARASKTAGRPLLRGHQQGKLIGHTPPSWAPEAPTPDNYNLTEKLMTVDSGPAFTSNVSLREFIDPRYDVTTLRRLDARPSDST